MRKSVKKEKRRGKEKKGCTPHPVNDVPIDLTWGGGGRGGGYGRKRDSLSGGPYPFGLSGKKKGGGKRGKEDDKQGKKRGGERGEKEGGCFPAGRDRLGILF